MITMAVMSDRYQRLLEAAIRHLEDQKSQGVKFILVRPETLAGLGSPSVRESSRTVALPGRSATGPRPAISMAESTVAAPPSESPGSPPASAGAVLLDHQTKQAAMAELRARARVCQKCLHLAASRKNVVFGVG